MAAGGGTPHYGTITASTLGAYGDVTGNWIKNPGCLGAIITINQTAQSSTLTLPTFKIQGRIGGGSSGYTFASVATTATPGVVQFKVHPALSSAGAVGTGGVASAVGAPIIRVKDVLPAQFRINSTNVGSGTVTWEAYVDFIPS